MSHYMIPEIVVLAERSSELTLQALFERAARDLGSREITVEFSRDVIHKLVCSSCGEQQELFAPVGAVRYEDGRCPRDGQMRVVETARGYTGGESYGARTLDKLGLPGFDIFVARNAEREIGYLLGGDRAAVLGELAKGAA
jgi:hypothetical protein